MCFSLQASTIAAASLITLGSIGVKRNRARKTIMIASIPLIFGIQQACEAVLWAQVPLGLSPAVTQAAAYTFLFFAYFFWPIWGPVSLWYAEPNEQRKKLLCIPLIAGILCGITLLYYIITTPVSSCVQCAHIIYDVGIPESLYIPGTVLYGCAAIAPWFISSLRRMWLVGIMLAISYIVSLWFYYAALTSVWCFFAAILSTLILVILDKNSHTQ